MTQWNISCNRIFWVLEINIINANQALARLMRICTYIYINENICMYICKNKYVNRYVYVYVHIYKYIHTLMYIICISQRNVVVFIGY